VAGTNYVAATGPVSELEHTWSLAVEEQFYLGQRRLDSVGRRCGIGSQSGFGAASRGEKGGIVE
jgi:hypothetical protein